MRTPYNVHKRAHTHKLVVKVQQTLSKSNQYESHSTLHEYGMSSLLTLAGSTLNVHCTYFKISSFHQQLK